MSWTPLFSGKSAEPYEQSINEILDALDHHGVAETDWGRALLHACVSLTRSSQAHRARTDELLDRAAAALERGTLPSSLYSGFAGVGWLCAHVDRLFGRHDDAAYEDIDAALGDAIGRLHGPLKYDLISGPVGLAVYFLERLPCARAADALGRIVDVLSAHSVREGDSITWHTSPVLLPEWQRQVYPQGYYNLGVPHGVPGIVGMLAMMKRAGITSLAADTLLGGALRWVINQRLPNGRFPHFVVPGREPTGSRVAWCYGEFGVSVTLLLGARVLGDAAAERVAVDVALGAAARREDAGVKDAGLCHGAAGNAHLFNRLFQATGRPEFRDAATYWFERTLAFRVHGDGIAGYRAWRPGIGPEQATKNPWECDPTFLTGASGIALALLAATTPVAPSWDATLLASVEPASEDHLMNGDHSSGAARMPRGTVRLHARPTAHRVVNHSADKWAWMVAQVLTAGHDPRTLAALGRMLGMSLTSVKDRCKAVGMTAKQTLDLARLLRACRLSEVYGESPTELLDAADPRTVKRLLNRLGSTGNAQERLSIDAVVDRLAAILPSGPYRALRGVVTSGRRLAP